MGAKRKKNTDTDTDTGRYRIQASTEAEVARARLTRAREAAEQGDRGRALDLAVESAFDAGVSQAFALLAGETNYNRVTDKLLDEAQSFVRMSAPSMASERPSKSKKVANPKSSKNALSKAKAESSVVQRIFYAGLCHGYAMADGDNDMMQRSIRVFDEYRNSQEPRPLAVAANPGVASISAHKLKQKLLR